MTAPLSRQALRAIEIARREQSVYVSAISVWELAMLVARKRFQVNKPVRTWVQEAFEQPDIQLLPLAPDIAIEATELPRPMHKDPADRMIVASARVERLTLITCDRPMLAFAKATGLACIEG
jgi:PIN domain nuclease of toxin-antitoxin system